MAEISMQDRTPAEVACADAYHRIRSRSSAMIEQLAKQPGQSVGGSQRLRVLVVNDDASLAASLAVSIRNWGHAATAAEGGAAALQLATTMHPDVVILDLQQEPLNAYQVAWHLRHDYPRKECWIIALSAAVDREHRQRCVDAGIDLLLIKPVDTAVIETLLLLEGGLTDCRSRSRRAASANGLPPAESV